MVTTAVGSVVNTAQVARGSNVVVFGVGGIGLNVIQGAEMVGTTRSSGRYPRRRSPLGMTDFVTVQARRRHHPAPGLVTDGGADYSFDCTGDTAVMRQALECCHRGCGMSAISTSPAAAKEIVWSGGARGRTSSEVFDW